MSNTPDLPPPVPPTVIPPVVATLDPDLANAYLAGVPGVVQAVANGMTTNAMIVNDLIRTGASMAGMPSAIVQMVSDRQKEIDAQREAENERVRKLAASAVGLGLMATAAQGGMYYGGEGEAKGSSYSASNPPTSAQFALLSEAERSAYLNSVMAETLSQWSSHPPEVRQQHLTNSMLNAEDTMKRGRDEVVRIESEMRAKGLSEAEMAKVRSVYADVDTNSPAGQQTIKDRIRDLYQTDPALVGYAQEMVAAVTMTFAGGDGYNTAYGGKGADANGNLKDSKEAFDKSVSTVENGTAAAANALCMNPDDYRTRAAISTAADVNATQADAALQSMAAQAAPTPSAEATVNQTVSANLVAGATVDTQVAKANFEEKIKVEAAMSDEYASDTPARKPSIAASNLGNGPDSRLAELGARPEAANDPKAPESIAEPERPRVASLSQGMGA